MPDETAIELFVDESDGVEAVGLVMRNPSILEYDDELAPGCRLNREQARQLARALDEYAAAIE